jgi:hypothetical protein
VQGHIKAFIGLAKVELLKGQQKVAREYYNACLMLLNSYELFTPLEIKREKETL